MYNLQYTIQNLNGDGDGDYALEGGRALDIDAEEHALGGALPQLEPRRVDPLYVACVLRTDPEPSAGSFRSS